MTRGRGRLTAAGAALAAAVGACVRVDPGPGGIASARLDTPPSIVAGDVLRDSAGRETTLRALAFDEEGRPVTSPSLRFVYVPAQRDTLQRLVLDSALVVVDSVQGEIRARSPFVASQGLVAVRIGDRLQIVDTIQIVPRPTAAQAETAITFPLRFSCADTTRERVLRPLAPNPNVPGIDTSYVYNALGPFRVRVSGDSVEADGTTRRAVAGVRARLVRWRVVSGPLVPAVRLPGGTARDTVPAIGVVTPRADRLTALDTTDDAGRSTAQLRIRPFGLTRSAVPTDTFSVVLQADVQPGPVTVTGATQRFTVRLERDPRVNCP